MFNMVSAGFDVRSWVRAGALCCTFGHHRVECELHRLLTFSWTPQGSPTESYLYKRRLQHALLPIEIHGTILWSGVFESPSFQTVYPPEGYISPHYPGINCCVRGASYVCCPGHALDIERVYRERPERCEYARGSNACRLRRSVRRM